MKAWGAIALVACGHAAPGPAVIANRAPPEIDAGVPDQVDAAAEAGDDGEACSGGDPIALRQGGHARIETCIGEDSHAARAELVLDRGDGSVRITMAEWETDSDGTMRITIMGVLRSPSGDDAVLVENDGYGEAEGLAGSRAALQVMAVRDGAWVSLHEVDGNVLDVRVSADRKVATVGARNEDGGAPTVELRWDGERVDETDVSAAP